jgi:hypothetical protein
MTLPRFLDIEASSFDSESYPIEIAWSDVDGNIESHLINPYCVEHWNDWDYAAQNIHGISRKQCREEGVHPRWLCERLNQSIKPGNVIYADGLPFDEWWTDALYAAGSTLGFAQFRILPTDSILLPLLAETEPEIKKRLSLFDSLKQEVRQKIGKRHRAALDVQYLIELYRVCAKFKRNSSD